MNKPKTLRPALIDLKAQWASELGLSANPTAQFGAPVSFTAHLDNLLPGQTIPLSTTGLANGYRTSYVIDEIRMQAYMSEEGATVLQPSAAVKFQFRTGAYKMSEVPVPMILHQPVYNKPPPPTGSPGGTAVLGGNFGPGPFGDAVQLGDEARWCLAKPLWMAPGDQIQAVVQRDAIWASAGAAAFSVDVTYVGRSLKPGTPGPKIRYVPWAAHYAYDFDTGFAQTTTEFRNPFQQPLVVQRFIGRPFSKATSGVFNTHTTNMLPDSVGDQYVSFYMEDSLGYKINREFAPVGCVFDPMKCAWTFSRPLGGGGSQQFNIQLRTDGTVDAADRMFGLAMLGYREEG